MMEGYSLSDIAAATGDMGGNNSFFWIFALLLLAGGGNFFGNSRGGEQYATSADVQRGFDTSEITRKLDSINTNLASGICDSTYALNNSIKDSAYATQQAVGSEGRAAQTQIAEGFCSTKSAIDGLKFDMSNYHADTNATVVAQTQKILDSIAQNKIDSLQNRVNQLELINATANTVKYPTQSTYCSGANPFCGCNSGF